ncbi:MAG: class I SAM-dependent methyltransferase [Anaerolineae bacterium]|nr:class I SAM-dependent methyltransferase [Anaerolineae bacterium]
MLSRFRRLIHPRPRTLPSQAAYALWSVAYPPEAHNPLMAIEQEAMLRLLPPLTGRAVLDLACGTGRYGLIARQQGARFVAGADNSWAMLQAGKLRPSAEADMTYLPFAPGTFDVILCGLAIGHLPPRQMQWAMGEMARVLCPGGAVLISDFHPFLYLLGQQRTFTAPNGKTYAVEHYPYLASDYYRTIRDVGMTITAMDEVKANREGQIVPAVFIIRCQRL